jgi:large subunit ribosomal protein L9
MEIILLERVEKLGGMGDVVNVKPGFARNFLLPQAKALRATKANLARFEAQREFLEKRNAETRAAAATSGEDLDGSSYVIIRKAGETGQLYGSVSARDVVEVVSNDVKRNMVVLEQPIKALGLHNVSIKLHPEVAVTVIVNVARSEEEAERQAKGEDVIAAQMDQDRAVAEDAAAERAEIAAEMFDEGRDPEQDIPETADEPKSEEEE